MAGHGVRQMSSLIMIMKQHPFAFVSRSLPCFRPSLTDDLPFIKILDGHDGSSTLSLSIMYDL